MSYIKRSKIFTGLVTGFVVLTIASSVGLFLMFVNGEHLRQNLNKEKLEHEKTINEKLMVDKDLTYLQRELNKLDATNHKLSTYLYDAEVEVSDKDKTIANLAADNADLERIKENLGGMQLDNASLEAQVKGLAKSIDELINRNNTIIRRMNELADEQDQLRLNYEKNLVQKGVGRAFRVEAQRGSKLTTKARRTKALEVSFEPIDRDDFMRLKQEVFYIILSDETGSVYNLMQNNKATVQLHDKTIELMPSFILEASENADKINRISFVIDDISKLAAGIYHLEVYTSTAFVGNTQIRLN